MNQSHGTGFQLPDQRPLDKDLQQEVEHVTERNGRLGATIRASLADVASHCLDVAIETALCRVSKVQRGLTRQDWSPLEPSFHSLT